MQLKNVPGFSLLELMIVLALIGMLGAFVVPNLFRPKLGAARKEFLAKFEGLIKGAVLRSILENKVHQIYMNVQKKVVQIRVPDRASIENNEHQRFAKLDDPSYTTQIDFPEQFKIQNFFIQGIESVNGELIDVMFYIMADGTSQIVVANLLEIDDTSEQDSKFSFKINPFYARISVYETFQSP